MSREAITSKLINDDRVFDTRHKAYILASIAWETGHTFQPVKEAYWLSERWREKNLRYYPWYGRGYIQITWEENYLKAENLLPGNPPLTKDLTLALNPDIAYDIAVVGMRDGWFTGRDLDDFINEDYCDFYRARRIVNGMDRAREIEMLARKYLADFTPRVEAIPKKAHRSDGVLMIGNKGEDVVRLQSALNLYFIGQEYSNYTPIKEDGHFGSITQGAVLKFQFATNLHKDGIVGPLTRAKLFA